MNHSIEREGGEAHAVERACGRGPFNLIFMFLFLKTMMCQSIPCHKIGDLRGLDIASCFILLLQIGKWLLANDIRASFHFIKSNKLFIGGLVRDLALGTICVMCLTIIRPMVMDVENVVLLLGFFFFFFRHDYIVHWENKTPKSCQYLWVGATLVKAICVWGWLSISASEVSSFRFDMYPNSIYPIMLVLIWWWTNYFLNNGLNMMFWTSQIFIYMETTNHIWDTQLAKFDIQIINQSIIKINSY